MCERSVGNILSFRFYEIDHMHTNLNTNGNLKYSSVTFHTLLTDNELKSWNIQQFYIKITKVIIVNSIISGT